MKKLILVTSPPACGKTFVSMKLAEALSHVVYLDKDTLTQFVTKDDLWCWKNGTQHIWELLAEKLNNKPQLNTEITKVVRENGKVEVTTSQGTEEFDKIIVTAPLEFMPQYFDATDKEKEYFSKIISKHFRFCSRISPISEESNSFYH